MLNKQAELLSTEEILGNMLQVYDNELLQNPQRLSAMISDLFAHDPKTKRLLLLSVRENIPLQLTEIKQSDTSLRTTKIHAIQHRLAADAFLKEEAAEQIVVFWTTALGWKIEEPKTKINNKEYFINKVGSNKFAIIDEIYNGLFKVGNGTNDYYSPGIYGVLDLEGITILPISFLSIYSMGENLICAYDSAFNIYNQRGVKLASWDEDLYKERRGGSFSEGLCMVIKNKKVGYINNKCEVEVPFIYDVIQGYYTEIVDLAYSEGKVMVCKDNKFGFIDRAGNIVCPIKYDIYLEGEDQKDNPYLVSTFKNGFAKVILNNKIGLINAEGTLITQIKYDYISEIVDGLGYVEINEKYGVINNSGVQLTPLKYDVNVGEWYKQSAEGMIRVGIGFDLSKKFGFVNSQGLEIIPLIYGWAERFKNGFAEVTTLDYEHFFIDKNGKRCFDEKIPGFNEGITLVRFENNTYGFVNDIGEYILSRYSYVKEEEEGLSAVEQDSKWGYIDQAGNMKIILKYDDAESFYDGLAIVKSDNKWGFIDKQDNVVIPIIFDAAYCFSNDGKAKVMLEGETFFINLQGNRIE